MGSDPHDSTPHAPRDDGARLLVLERADPETARVRLAGTFHGAPVLWDARVLTLRRYQADLGPGAGPVRAFIDVHRVEDGRGEVVVGLPVARVDDPTLLKTATMLRQWKRLDRGRHEFGRAYDYRAEPASAVD
jgi:hypothetical protein